MYGDETLYFAVSPTSGTGQFLGSGPGKNAMLRWDERTTVSAVAVLRQPSGSELVVDLYHNRYAIVPMEPSVSAPFVRRQIGIGIDAPERDAPTWLDVRDNPDYEDFWRDPESAMERVVREILEDKEGKC